MLALLDHLHELRLKIVELFVSVALSTDILNELCRERDLVVDDFS